MIVDITLENAQDTIVGGSADKNVIVYMFDPEDPKTAALTSTLSMQVGESPSLLLAKVDLRKTPQLARMLPIGALPALVVIRNGQIAGQLEGDEAYDPKDFVQKFLPQEDELLYQSACELLKEEKLDGALEKIQQALAIKNAASYRMTQADIYIRQNRLEEAQTLIDGLTMEEQLDVGDYYNTLQSALNLAKQAVADSPIEDLKKQVEADPDNLDLKIELAVQYNKLNQKTPALDQLLEVLRKDLNYANAKQTYLDILETMGSSSVVSSYRRQLYTLMY